MTGEFEQNDLAERVRLIESMMAEGRRTTAKWGWSFVLWGIAYLVATAWATWGKSYQLAWPVTMIAAAVLTAVGASRVKRGQPGTMVSRVLGGTWTAMGVSLSVVLFSLAASGRYDGHVFVAIVGAMLGTANGVSAFILRWKMQYACAVIWLAVTVAACFGSEAVAGIAFLAATFLGQIVFGVYAMVLDARRGREHGVAHA
jgi:hypothetical protein